MNVPNCPKGHGPMAPQKIKKEKTFRGVDIEYMADIFACPECGLEAATVAAAGEVQRAMAEAYREKAGLLTAREIRSLRDARGMTQQQLADVMGTGIASIKRWETGMIQSKSMDLAMRKQLQCCILSDDYSGNRAISLPRIKLVAQTFEGILGKRLLKQGDRLLYLAKYLWYADMLAYRKLGRGLTGASYAAIPYGPQLNNYKDLVEPILASDIHDAEPLSEEEARIVQQVAEKFPKERAVFDAAHRERVWSDSPVGALIPYTCAADLAEI